LDKVIKAIRAIYADGIEQNHESAIHLATLCDAIDQLGPEQTVQTSSYGIVGRCFQHALSHASNDFAQILSAALDSRHDRFFWQQPDYGDAEDFRVLHANYAFALIAAPKQWSCSNYYCENVFFGISLQAPHTLYAGHAHKAPEVYYVVSGKSQWKRGTENWTERTSGSLVFHDHYVSHAMQSFDEPLLSLFAWTSDLDGEIVAVSDDH